MKKFLFFAAAASVALVACTKNEVAQIDNEITYQTVQTRATSAFSTSTHFISYAYFLPQGKNWNDNYDDPIDPGAPNDPNDPNDSNNLAKPYISGAEIYFQTDRWKAASTYYWPKQGKLTFFAWSTNKPNNATPSILPNPGTVVDCSPAKGISVDSYDLTKNKNVDFLVAEVAKDKTANTETFEGWQAGVPTIFKHALSSIAFKVQTVDPNNNNNGKVYEDVTFTVKSIHLLQVSTTASYAQTWNAAAPSSHVWADHAAPGDIPAYTKASGQVVTSTATVLAIDANNDYSIVLPQTIDSAMKFKIVYDIETRFTGSPVTETVTEIIDLDDIYAEGWKPGKKYTVTLKLSMNEILWAPDVTEWEFPATEFPI